MRHKGGGSLARQPRPGGHRYGREVQAADGWAASPQISTPPVYRRAQDINLQRSQLPITCDKQQQVYRSVEEE
jgi:hypothetical protein